jgi:hypothetical protein
MVLMAVAAPAMVRAEMKDFIFKIYYYNEIGVTIHAF